MNLVRPLAVAGLMGATFWLSFALMNRSSPIVSAVIAVNQPGVPGGYIHVEATVEYRQSCAAYVARALYDSTGRRFTGPLLQLPAQPIGVQITSSDVPLPHQFAVGPARVVSSPQYACTWLQAVFPFLRIATPDRVASFLVLAP